MANEENRLGIDPIEEFFRPRPLWELLKKYHGNKPIPWTEPMRVPEQFEEYSPD
jgi:hypothetical protein